MDPSRDEQTGDSEQSREEHGPKEHNPMQSRLVDNLFSGCEILFDVAQGRSSWLRFGNTCGLETKVTSGFFGLRVKLECRSLLVIGLFVL